MRTFLPILFLLALAACTEEEPEKISDRSIRGRWHLTSMRLSQPVDLNLDGTASTDMVSEFNCLRHENIRISRNGNDFTFTHANLEYDASAPNGGYFCNNAAGNHYNSGDVEKIDEHTILLHFVHANPAYAAEYSVIDGVLSKTYTALHPTSYDAATQTWTKTQVQIRKEYKRD